MVPNWIGLDVGRPRPGFGAAALALIQLCARVFPNGETARALDLPDAENSPPGELRHGGESDLAAGSPLQLH
jgi:hypothetical protein